MIEPITRNGAEPIVRRALCSCFLAVDDTITLRREMVSDAAKAIVTSLRAHGLLDRDVRFPEQAICSMLRPNGGSAVPVSVSAALVASRICAAMCPR
jgi:hypothetical protein